MSRQKKSPKKITKPAQIMTQPKVSEGIRVQPLKDGGCREKIGVVVEVMEHIGEISQGYDA